MALGAMLLYHLLLKEIDIWAKAAGQLVLWIFQKQYCSVELFVMMEKFYSF